MLFIITLEVYGLYSSDHLPLFVLSIGMLGIRTSYMIRSWGQAAAGLRAAALVLLSDSLTLAKSSKIRSIVPPSLSPSLPSFLPDTFIKQLCCARHKDQNTQGPLKKLKI